MSASSLVLSVFDGINLLGLAFRREGYCVVCGGDIIWGSEWDVRGLHPPAGVFEGVIGGDPCQEHSRLAHLVRHNGHQPKFPDMTPEYVRVVWEAQPVWFVRENVPGAPTPRLPGYDVWSVLLVDAHVGGLQPRERRIWFGMREGLWPEPLRSPLSLIEYTEGSRRGLTVLASDTAPSESRVPYGRKRATVIASDSGIAYQEKRRHSVLADARQVPVKMGSGGKFKVSVVTAGHGRAPGQCDAGGDSVLPIEDVCEAMGLPRDFTAEMPFTMHGKRSVIGNGVPLAMGTAIARAVRRATAGLVSA